MAPRILRDRIVKKPEARVRLPSKKRINQNRVAWCLETFKSAWLTPSFKMQ
jgi:hypothetical protein